MFRCKKDDKENDVTDINRVRKWTLFLGEIVDAWRIIPRSLVALYGLMMYYLIKWFISLETHIVTKCDNKLLNSLTEQGVGLDRAEQIACTATEVVGGPTNGQTAFVTAVCGLASAIFGFYTKTGKDWSKPIPRWNMDEKSQDAQQKKEQPAQDAQADSKQNTK